MFGLTTLQHIVNPQNSIEKAWFLVEYAPLHMHKVTALISFTSLGVLVVLRIVKTALKRYTWIYRLPEVLVVVVVSTRKSSVTMLLRCLSSYFHSPQR